MKVPCPETYPEMDIQAVIQKFMLRRMSVYMGSFNLLKREVWYGIVDDLIQIETGML